jgi:hypothetical protein
MGFEHVVANMFFLPAAIFADVPGLGWDDVIKNWLLAGVGNLVGAVVFVATSYWYLFLKDGPTIRQLASPHRHSQRRRSESDADAVTRRSVTSPRRSVRRLCRTVRFAANGCGQLVGVAGR